jgi:hypothetical protein
MLFWCNVNRHKACVPALASSNMPRLSNLNAGVTDVVRQQRRRRRRHGIAYGSISFGRVTAATLCLNAIILLSLMQ